MSLRVCSILGTWFLVLAVTTPAFAERKQHSADKASDRSVEKTVYSDDESKLSEADDSEQWNAKAKKRKARKGKKAKGKDKAEDDKAEDDKAEGDKASEGSSTETTAADSTLEPTVPEPSAWEKPPEDEEKPVLSPAAKKALEPIGDGRPWYTALAVGWGFKTDRQVGYDFGSDPYGLGFGLRGGYTFDIQLYAGVFGMYYIGSSTRGPIMAAGIVSESTASYLHAGLEFGYDFWLGPIVLRPSAQLGAAVGFRTTDGAPGNPATEGRPTGFLLSPGIVVFHPLDDLFIGGEGRFNFVTGDGIGAVLLAFNIGFRFSE